MLSKLKIFFVGFILVLSIQITKIKAFMQNIKLAEENKPTNINKIVKVGSGICKQI